MKKTNINFVIMLAISSLLNFAPSVYPSGNAFAQENRISIRGSNLEIPRFVTLKSNRVNMRTGPGKEYPIQWEYQRKGLPLKVIGEFDVWRKVTDHEGVIGWMHVRTLSIKKMVLVIDSTVKIHQRADDDAPISAIAEKGVIAELVTCKSEWCKIKSNEISGWLYRKSLWGLLDGENFE